MNKVSSNQITLASANQLKPKSLVKELPFASNFTDHMLRITWSKKDGWSNPKISPITHISLHPAAKVLHYAEELYEGMKVIKV